MLCSSDLSMPARGASDQTQVKRDTKLIAVELKNTKYASETR